MEPAPSPICGQDTNVLAPSTPLAMLTHPGAFGAFFGMGCAWLRAAGGGCLRQGVGFRRARWCGHRQIGSEERPFPNLTKEQREEREGSVSYCVCVDTTRRGVKPLVSYCDENRIDGQCKAVASSEQSPLKGRVGERWHGGI